MSWYQLLDIQKEDALYREQLRRDGPRSCPNDGEPLQQDSDGNLHCRFDGWVYNGDTFGL